MLDLDLDLGIWSAGWRMGLRIWDFRLKICESGLAETEKAFSRKKKPLQ
jgi:hypothetical protein